ncbi:MAG: glycerophosphodiester phosphodiesterase family protein [Deltaproteobacteria bacterium]|nr:glycerophosphodiester phosphodiesterase family protein [Deltaproteobacteria bacterium]
MRRTLHDIILPVIIGHRGYRAKYPENTLASFSAAMAAGAEMIELDVTLSKDRKVVVIHDDTLNRTTSGFGPVHQATLQALKRLDAGSWFDSRFAAESLPTLEEVLILAGGKILINIEIKSSAWESGFPEDAVERQVVDLIIRHDLLNSTLVSSFHAGFLKNIGKLPVHPEIAFITDRKAPQNTLDMCQRLGVFSWHPHYKSLKQRHIEKAHAQGILIFPYTVNMVENMLMLVDMGVDGVITDDPGAAISCIAAKRKTSAFIPPRD